ncbi:hypothetical protein BJ508DRAFT_302837 [Ascobolus immersus RN42]|uniref:Uncharacterized protein n=1 Tax=Ascobolus immersus RN42 TaxID=1160509 RepID=A0A3N4IN72_ASCIM|nr:hypothetical protein BJ508DRAFT_302837 [Ascobolus immersus RN42]
MTVRWSLYSMNSSPVPTRSISPLTSHHRKYRITMQRQIKVRRKAGVIHVLGGLWHGGPGRVGAVRFKTSISTSDFSISRSGQFISVLSQQARLYSIYIVTLFIRSQPISTQTILTMQLTSLLAASTLISSVLALRPQASLPKRSHDTTDPLSDFDLCLEFPTLCVPPTPSDSSTWDLISATPTPTGLPKPPVITSTRTITSSPTASTPSNATTTLTFTTPIPSTFVTTIQTIRTRTITKATYDNVASMYYSVTSSTTENWMLVETVTTTGTGTFTVTATRAAITPDVNGTKAEDTVTLVKSTSRPTAPAREEDSGVGRVRVGIMGLLGIAVGMVML